MHLWYELCCQTLALSFCVPLFTETEGKSPPFMQCHNPLPLWKPNQNKRNRKPRVQQIQWHVHVPAVPRPFCQPRAWLPLDQSHPRFLPQHIVLVGFACSTVQCDHPRFWWERNFHKRRLWQTIASSRDTLWVLCPVGNRVKTLKFKKSLEFPDL